MFQHNIDFPTVTAFKCKCGYEKHIIIDYRYVGEKERCPECADYMKKIKRRDYDNKRK